MIFFTFPLRKVFEFVVFIVLLKHKLSFLHSSDSVEIARLYGFEHQLPIQNRILYVCFPWLVSQFCCLEKNSKFICYLQYMFDKKQNTCSCKQITVPGYQDIHCTMYMHSHRKSKLFRNTTRYFFDLVFGESVVK